MAEGMEYHKKFWLYSPCFATSCCHPGPVV